jgi:hypothetical protein
MRRIILITALVGILFFVGMGLMNLLNAQTIEGTSSAAIMSKLSEITKNQQTILSKLDDIKNDLHIIQIRASRK